ncbi:MAG: CBS domain-containing protein [Desulfopila sp.]
MPKKDAAPLLPLEISDQDVLAAMTSIPGYLDITPSDFREVYQVAYTLAIKRLLSSITAADLMSRSVHLLQQEMPLVEAAALLADKGISGAPVVDSAGKIVGVVSEKDFLREMGFGATPSFMQIATHCLNDKSCMIGLLRNKSVGNIMTRPALTGPPDLTIGEISQFFKDHGINRLPILAADGRPVGIVTRTDLARSCTLFAERIAS